LIPVTGAIIGATAFVAALLTARANALEHVEVQFVRAAWDASMPFDHIS
jgi:hypothetical protein